MGNHLLPEPTTLPATRYAVHEIDVGNSKPICQKAYHVTPIIRDDMWKEVDRLLKEGIIEPSQSEWASPVVMVKKSNGKWRFCIDFRKVNGVSKKDAYPLPNMLGILDQLRQAHYISTIDLSQAYFQIPLADAAKPITAFIVPGRGLFQFTRMPFGLSNAPATLQRYIEKVLGPELYPHVFVYLDDIIIVATSFVEHLKWLRIVLEKLQSAGLTINREKSEFCCSEVKYLGFIVNKSGLQVDPEKTSSVTDFPAPRNIKQIRRFLGMASWYRRFIPDFATIAQPLSLLTKKKQPWVWDTAQHNAFDTLKTKLTTAPTLLCPDFSLPFTLQTDASSVGLGAVLTQVITGEEHVIAYAGRSLTRPERNYTVTEQECLAVLWSIRKFRGYLEGYKFTVITDHSSLRWLHKIQTPSGRLARWSLELMSYDLEIIHRKGALHHVPDALSRIPEEDVDKAIDTTARGSEMVHVITEDVWYTKRCREVEQLPDKFPDWRLVEDRLYHHKPDSFQDSEVNDLNAWKLVLNRELRLRAIEESHATVQSGHQGVDKTFRRLSSSYYWPQMFRDVVVFIRHCRICQQTKIEQAKPTGFMGRKTVEQPWTVIAADVMGPFPRSRNGFLYVLIVQDLYSKWIEIEPLKRATGPIICSILESSIFS